MKKLILIGFVWTSLALSSGCNKVSEPDDAAGGASSGGSDDGSGGSTPGKGGEGGAGTGGARPEPECFEDPKTHHEIINACTQATRVEKKPKLKLLNADGSLPEL